MSRLNRQRVRFQRTQTVEIIFEVDGVATKRTIEKFTRLGPTNKHAIDVLIKKGKAICKTSRWKAVTSQPPFSEPLPRGAKTKGRR